MVLPKLSSKIALLLFVGSSDAFVPHSHKPLLKVATRKCVGTSSSRNDFQSFDPCGFVAPTSEEADLMAQFSGKDSHTIGAVSSLAVLMALPDSAWAKGGEYGLGEGRIVSMAHPVMMGGLFFVSLGAAYTGFQWRRIRDLAGEISELKTELKIPEAELSRLEADEESTNGGKIAELKSQIADLTASVEEKTATRKDLVALDFRDRHWALGSVLLGLGVSFGIEGPVNTYMRAGKLFPGPHLYAGAAVVSAWALAAALVPQMQKGKDWARSMHVGLNAGATALFLYYQIPTGLEIAAKVIEKTKFP